MPHIELHHTSDLDIDSLTLFKDIEKIINSADGSAGACKSRTYQIETYLHKHINLSVKVLKKPHRDDVFMDGLLKQIENAALPFIQQGCFYSIELSFSGERYITSKK